MWRGYQATKPIPFLKERGVHLSASHIYRPAAEKPERLNLQVLVRQMGALDCSAADLIGKVHVHAARGRAAGTEDARGTGKGLHVLRERASAHAHGYTFRRKELMPAKRQRLECGGHPVPGEAVVCGPVCPACWRLLPRPPRGFAPLPLPGRVVEGSLSDTPVGDLAPVGDHGEHVGENEDADAPSEGDPDVAAACRWQPED